MSPGNRDNRSIGFKWWCHTFRADSRSGGELILEAQLADSLRRESNLDVIQLEPSDYARFDSFPTLLQTGVDVHGSHGLFYWLRTRGAGILVRNDRTAAVLAWRPDFGSLVVVRPVGDPDAIAEVFGVVRKVVSNTWPGISLVAWYCTDAVADRMVDRGWIASPSPLLSDALLDDEAYPEVLIVTDPAEMPSGGEYRTIRKAILRYSGSCFYFASTTPIRCGESEFIINKTARTRHFGGRESDFNKSVVAALDFPYHDQAVYHYLFRDSELVGFAITGNTTGISHGYYLGTIRSSRISTYFHWRIYQEERRRGALAYNLGGSESESLHLFKTQTFPDHILRRTRVLYFPSDWG
jgi:hypothetical protein